MAAPVEPRLVLNCDGFTVMYKGKDDTFIPQWTEVYNYAAEKRLENLTMAYGGLKIDDNDIMSGLYLVSEGDTNLTIFSARRLGQLYGYDYCLALPQPPPSVKTKVRYVPKKEFDEPKLGLSNQDMERADISFVLNGVYYRAHCGIFYVYARFRPDRKLVGSECFYQYSEPEKTLKYSTKVIGVYGTPLDGLYMENRYTHRIVRRIVGGDRSKGSGVMSFERAS